jgi:ribosomal protein S17
VKVEEPDETASAPCSSKRKPEKTEIMSEAKMVKPTKQLPISPAQEELQKESKLQKARIAELEREVKKLQQEKKAEVVSPQGSGSSNVVIKKEEEPSIKESDKEAKTKIEKLLHENKQLKVSLEELRAKVGDMVQACKDKGVDEGLVESVLETTGLKPFLKVRSVFTKLYDDAVARIDRLEKLREKYRLEKERQLASINETLPPLRPLTIDAVIASVARFDACNTKGLEGLGQRALRLNDNDRYAHQSPSHSKVLGLKLAGPSHLQVKHDLSSINETRATRQLGKSQTLPSLGHMARTSIGSIHVAHREQQPRQLASNSIAWRRLI